MSHTERAPNPEVLLTRLAQLLQRGPDGRYVYPASATPALVGMIEASALGAQAVEELGAVLKLIYVLRCKQDAPSAADALVQALRASETAKRIIALHWSGGGGEPTLGSDLQPRGPKRAPHVAAKDAAGALKVSSFLTPGANPRAARIERRVAGRSS